MVLLRAWSSQVLETPEGAGSAVSQDQSQWLIILTVKITFFSIKREASLFLLWSKESVFIFLVTFPFEGCEVILNLFFSRLNTGSPGKRSLDYSDSYIYFLFVFSISLLKSDWKMNAFKITCNMYFVSCQNMFKLNEFWKEMFLPMNSNVKTVSGGWKNGLIILMSCIDSLVWEFFRAVESPLPAQWLLDNLCRKLSWFCSSVWTYFFCRKTCLLCAFFPNIDLCINYFPRKSSS